MICITERWRAILPSVQRSLSEEFLQKVQDSGAGQYICELAYRRGGFVSLRNIPEMQEPLPHFPADASSSSAISCATTTSAK